MGLKGREQLMSTLRKNADKLVRGLALEAQGRLVRKTPVDTGRARANWNVARTSPDRSADRDADRSDVPAKLVEGRATIAEFGAGDRIFLTNALPYIPELEKGSSDQAPNGMVRVTSKELEPLKSKIAAALARGVSDVE